MRFKVGDHAMCVDDRMFTPDILKYFGHIPRVGDTFRVRAVEVVNAREGLRFDGVINRVHPEFNVEVAYFAFKFVHAPPIRERPARCEIREIMV